MFDAASASTASVAACGRGPVAPCSSGVAAKVGAASQHKGRPYSALGSRSDIGRVRRIGNRHRVGGITVFVAPGASGRCRAAFVAGRAVGPAVQRNRAKRRLREALARVPIRVGRDYLVMATAVAIEAPFEDLVAWLTDAATEDAIEEE